MITRTQGQYRDQRRRRPLDVAEDPPAPPRDIEMSNALQRGFGQPVTNGVELPDHLKPKPQADPRYATPAAYSTHTELLQGIRDPSSIGRRLDQRTAAEVAALPTPQASAFMPQPNHAGTRLQSLAEPLITKWYLTNAGRVPTPEEILLHTDKGRRSKDVNYVLRSLENMLAGSIGSGLR